MATLLKRLRALYLPFAVITVAIVAIPLVATLAIEAIEAAEVRIVQVEPASPAVVAKLPALVAPALEMPATALSDSDPKCGVGETTRNDICAQWRAAEAGQSSSKAAWFFGLVGTVVGAGTLAAAALAALYAKRAAQHTKAAADIAKTIGEAQTKAYLICASASYYLRKDQLCAALKIENIGNSPAVDVEMFGYVSVNDVSGRPSHFRVTRSVQSKTKVYPCQPITTKTSLTEDFFFFWDFDFENSDTSQEGTKFRRDTLNTGNEISFTITIRYKDVFGNVENAPLYLSAIIDAHPTAINKKRTPTGKLIIRINDFEENDYPTDNLNG